MQKNNVSIVVGGAANGELHSIVWKDTFQSLSYRYHISNNNQNRLAWWHFKAINRLDREHNWCLKSNDKNEERNKTKRWSKGKMEDWEWKVCFAQLRQVIPWGCHCESSWCHMSAAPEMLWRTLETTIKAKRFTEPKIGVETPKNPQYQLWICFFTSVAPP